VLELLSGGDLLDSVIENGTYSEADAREIFTQVLDGVAHIHGRGVVHRDLKVRARDCAPRGRGAGRVASAKLLELLRKKMTEQTLGVRATKESAKSDSTTNPPKKFNTADSSRLPPPPPPSRKLHSG
jgi:serine/threonine protein kinase